MATKRQTKAQERNRLEWLKCSLDPAYFLATYGWVYDATSRSWLQFDLWPAQFGVVDLFRRELLVIVLKARQLGLSWLAVGYALWLMIFRPAATVLFFSKRDDEAVDLLDFRLIGMYDRLPDWLRSRRIEVSNAHELALSNGSRAKAFPTTGGRAFTATLVLIDEADFIPSLAGLMRAVKPTVDAGAQLFLISTADKGQPRSTFKAMYHAAGEPGSAWHRLFLPWSARPDRSADWYAAQMSDILSRTGVLDDLYQEYPATDRQALAPRELDKRFAAEWLDRCDDVSDGLPDPGVSALSGLSVFDAPEPGRYYVIGADPAEGNPQSDESAASVVRITGEQVAVLAGRFDPAVFAGHLDLLGKYYGGAPVLVERNNHGHAVLLWLKEHASIRVLPGLDGRPGWVQSGASKPLLMDNLADCLRDRSTVIRDQATFFQLASIEGATLRAPEGQHDDRALAHGLALAALRWCSVDWDGVSGQLPPEDVIDDETDGW